MVIGTDCMGSCKSNYHTITTTTAPNSLNNQWYIRSDGWKIKILIFMCATILWNSLILEEHKNYILLHHSVGSSFFSSYQITVANDADSTIAEDK